MATEKRLIDAKGKFTLYAGGITGHIMCVEHGYATVFDRFAKVIYKFDLLDAPTVDAVELPCKIGDKVYRIAKGNDYFGVKPFIQELTVTEISWKKEKYGDKDLGFAIIADGIRYRFTSIGKSVFLTRKEAEAKMDGERKDNG